MKRSMTREGNFTRSATGFGMVLLSVLWAAPATPTETTTFAEADVFLTKIHTPKGVKPRAGGGAASRNITVKVGGDTMTQEASVRLKATPGGGVKVAVTPGSMMATLGTERGATTLRFSAEISCKNGTRDTSWAIRWFATISAPGNSDTTNDTLEGRTDVTCR